MDKLSLCCVCQDEVNEDEDERRVYTFCRTSFPSECLLRWLLAGFDPAILRKCPVPKLHPSGTYRTSDGIEDTGNEVIVSE
jgi:hypothetical protein